MRLEQAQVTLRKRRSWEALDLGVLLAQRWYGPLLALWCIGICCFLPLVWLAAWFGPVWLGFIVFWLALPLPECLTLLWSGEALFGKRLTIRKTLAKFRNQCGIGRGLIFCFYRLHPRRFLAYAALILEGCNRREAGERIAILGSGKDSGPAFPLMSQIVTVLLWLATLIIIVELVPHEWQWVEMHFQLKGRTLLVIYIIVAGLLAPFWATSGFMLYISRRVELEGWDLELGFRDLNLRLRREQRGKT